MNQRWREHRSLYRAAGEVILPHEYEVAALAGDRDTKAFVTTHHSKSYPNARFRFGLYRRDSLCGVAVFGHPSHDRVLTNVFACDATLSVELSRFVLLDEVPGNGETFFLGRIFELLRALDLVGVVAFSDPIPRRNTEGIMISPGHCGTIYQAFNGVYLGRSAARNIRLLPDGSVLHERTIQKIRRLEQGWKYASATLERFGAAPLTGNPTAWLDTWLPTLTNNVRHPGNHKYAWSLHRSTRRMLPASLPYPKFAPLFLCSGLASPSAEVMPS